MLRSSLSDYSCAYILVTVTITVANTAAQDQPNNGANKEVIFKNYLPFTKCISRINNTQVDDAHDINVVMPMYNFIENSNNYQKHLEFCGNILKIKQIYILLIIIKFLILTQMMLPLIRLKLNKSK